jgi:hypothetical protein
MRRMSARLVVAASALALAAPAIAAYVCHPDPAGTRSLSLRGRVTAYSLRGSTLTVALATRAGCGVLVWNSALRKIARTSRACASVVAADRRPTGVRIVGGTIDRPDRLDVLVGGRVARSWPLAVRARADTLQVSRGLAAFLVRGRSGLWVVRLRDGRATFVAPIPAHDRPLLDAQGVAFQDYVYKRRSPDRPLLKFVSARGLRTELARVARPLHTSGPIRSISVDGTRVALAVGAGVGGCDGVVFWSIPWRSAEQVSETRGPTCGVLGSSRGVVRSVGASRAESGRISKVVLGGARAEWITLHRGRPMVVAADDIGCEEWVISRLSDRGRHWALAGVAGNGTTLAYALVARSHGGTISRVSRVTGTYRAHGIFDVAGSVRALSVDGWRTAALAADGSITVRGYRGRVHRSFRSPGATSIALRGSRLVAAAPGRLDVYSLRTGRALHRWTLPAGARGVDLQYGAAVVTAGRSVYAIDIATGRTVRLVTAPAAVQAQIEPIGVVYAYSVGSRGTAALVPLSRVERLLGR